MGEEIQKDMTDAEVKRNTFNLPASLGFDSEHKTFTNKTWQSCFEEIHRSPVICLSR